MALLTTKARTNKFIPIYLDSLKLDSVLNFDLYVKLDGLLTLYRSADLPFTERTKLKLMDNGVNILYIDGSSKGEFQKYLEANLSEILVDPEIPQPRKAGILYETSKSLIEEVFSNPTFSDNIRRSEKLVNSTISYLLQGRDAFINLLRITSYNYSIYSHSVNVCAYSLALGQRLGVTSQKEQHELGIAALLHDVGKSRVSERILNKTGALSPREFEIMKRHPRWGVEILRETSQIPEISYLPVLQHHERDGGIGYPDKIGLEDMHLYSRIIAVVDCFDAMTTQRVYQNAMESFAALRVMNTKKNGFDLDILREFIMLLGPDDAAPDTTEDIF